MLKTLRLLTIFTVLFTGLSSHAVCLQKIDADLYECEKLSDSRAHSWCEDKYGNDYEAYYTTNVCSKSLAASLRGEDATSVKDDNGGVVPAVCLSYEQGQKLGCKVYDFVKAERYCSQNYGPRYVSFIEGGNCTRSAAAKIRGEVKHSKLLDKLKSLSDEIETGLTMLDKEGMEGAGVISTKRPNLRSEFYTSVVKALMGKMKILSGRLYTNSHLKIPFPNKYTADFLKYNFRYLRSLARLYKLYAYVAHRNHNALKTYRFENLTYLNLKIQKDYALEVMSKASFITKTIDSGKSLEFAISEQDKQAFEYSAVQMPTDKADYAKYLTFVGAREALTNTWSVDRLFSSKVKVNPIKSCGRGFLSFRSDNYGNIKKSKAYTELTQSDAFFTDYIDRADTLAKVSTEYNLLSTANAEKMVKSLFNSEKELKEMIASGAEDEGASLASVINRYAKEDAVYLIMAESEDWAAFAEEYFKTIVMPGDNLLNRNSIISRIIEDAYRRRSKAIATTFISSYVWVSDATIKSIETRIEKFLKDNVLGTWKNSLSNALNRGLGSYNNTATIAGKRYNNFIKRHEAIVKEFAHAARIKTILSKAKVFPKGVVGVDPVDVNQLFSFFQNYLISTNQYLRATLGVNKKADKILGEFKDAISTLYAVEIWPYIKDGKITLSTLKRQQLLRKVTIQIGKKLVEKYKLTSRDMLTRGDFLSLTTVAADNTRVHMDRRMPITQYEQQQSLPVPRQEYISAAGSSGRNNSDAVTTGKTRLPYSVDEDGVIYSKTGAVLDRTGVKFENYVSSVPFMNIEHVYKAKKSYTSFDFHTAMAKDSPNYLRSEKEIVREILVALNLEIYVFDTLNMNNGKQGLFANNLDKQRVLSDQIMQQAYEMAPLLRHETMKAYKYSVDKYGKLKAKESTNKKKKISYLEIIGSEAVSNQGVLNTTRSTAIVKEALNVTKRNIGGKLNKFCASNYLNYTKDQNFKDVFNSSGYIREVLKASFMQDHKYTERLHKFDESIRKEIRTKWEAANEDLIEPIAKVTGTIAIIALGVMLIVGTGGAAAPGVLGLGYGALASFVAIEFYIAFPFVASSAIHRINKNFIEVPQHLKMQESLAHAQLEQSEMMNWDYIAGMKKNNKWQKVITAALLPLDLWYGTAVTRSITRSLGVRGVKSYRRLTGLKLKMWSAPPKSMIIKRGYRELRKKHGRWKARVMQAGDGLRNARMYLPKNQPLSENMIKVAPLRMGWINKAKKIGVDNKPWQLLGDMKTYADKMRKRISFYDKYIDESGQLVRKVKLNGRLSLREQAAHAFQYSKALFMPRAWMKAAKEGKLVSVIKDKGPLLEKLKHLQGKLVQKRYARIRTTISKLEKLQKASGSGRYSRTKDGHATYVEKFLADLNHEELLVLEEIARKAKGPMRSFKAVYKDYKEVVQGLRPATYLYGNVGGRYATSAYPQNMFMDEVFDKHYAFKSDTQDIVNFYEAMMKQSAFKSKEGETDVIRREIEELLADRFGFYKNGKRFYKD